MSVLEQRKQNVMKFKGAMVAALTPYDQNGEVNVSQIDGYVKYLNDNKVDGAYIMGTTGEGYNLTNEERISIARAWRQAVDRQKVNLFTIVNVTSNCMKEALRFAKEADTLGFDGIAVLPPNYYRPNTVNDWVNYLKSFASVAPNTPLVYYHIPYMSGDMNFDIIEAIGEGLKQIPQLTAMKYTDNNIVRLSMLQKKYQDSFKIITGFDEMLLSALTALGLNSGICALFNLPEVVNSYKKVVKLVEASDLEEARREQFRIIDQTIRYKGDKNFVFKIKTAFNSNVKSLGLDFGRPRPPIHYHYKW